MTYENEPQDSETWDNSTIEKYRRIREQLENGTYEYSDSESEIDSDEEDNDSD